MGEEPHKAVGRVIDPAAWNVGSSTRHSLTCSSSPITLRLVPNYIREFSPGGTFFFTLVTHRRARLFRHPTARRLLRESIAHVRRRRPFTVEGMVLLPEHLHCVWSLPDGDTDFSTRWRKIKEGFTRAYLASDIGVERCVTPAARAKGIRGVWQQRFWEHTIRDDADFAGHMNYIHYNAVKHGYVQCPHAWPFSTFRKWIRRGIYTENWYCICGGGTSKPPQFENLAATAME